MAICSKKCWWWENKSGCNNTNAGLVISSNISTKLDCTISYSANNNVVRNTLQPQLSNDFFSHNTGAKFTWEFAKNLTLINDLTQTLYKV